MIVAQRLLEARAIRGVTATTVADRAGLGRPQLSVYESGEAVPRIETLVRLADALDVDLDYLAGRTAKPVSRSENSCRLASRISGLSEADRRLAELWLDTLAAARRGGDPNADLRLRRRIEAVRSQQT